MGIPLFLSLLTCPLREKHPKVISKYYDFIQAPGFTTDRQ